MQRELSSEFPSLPMDRCSQRNTIVIKLILDSLPTRENWLLIGEETGNPCRAQTHFVTSYAQFSSVQLLSHVWLLVTPWTTTHLASLFNTNCQSLPIPMSIKSVMPSNHLILCHPLLLLPSILPSIRGFSNESALHIRWPKYCSFSFNISPSNEHLGLVGSPCTPRDS